MDTMEQCCTDNFPRVAIVDCLSDMLAVIEANQCSRSQGTVASVMSNMQDKCAVVEIDTLEDEVGSEAVVCSLPSSISSHLATEVEDSGSVEASAVMAIVEDEAASQEYQELPLAAEDSTQHPSIVPIGNDTQPANEDSYLSIWSKKRAEMEKKAERKAQQRLHQYNREGKTTEEVIDEALKDYSEFHEMAPTVRLKFEEEKEKVLTLVKSMIDGRQKSEFNGNLTDGKNSRPINAFEVMPYRQITVSSFQSSGFEYFLDQSQGLYDEVEVDRHSNKRTRADDSLKLGYSLPIGLRGRPFVPHPKM